MPKIFEVGGCVRDKILGLDSKDIDFTFVLDDLTISVNEGFKLMVSWLKNNGFEIFVSHPECYTVRARFPKYHKNAKLTADFVMARKEVGYEPDSRKPILILGSLEDDLIRRDFTVNAMAIGEDGEIIDLFNGKNDLMRKVLMTPTDPKKTLLDDPLRMVRAIRFSITKDLNISDEIYECFLDEEFTVNFLAKMKKTVSSERFREELFKMFKFNTSKSIESIFYLNEMTKLDWFRLLFDDNNMWLKPTTEK